MLDDTIGREWSRWVANREQCKIEKWVNFLCLKYLIQITSYQLFLKTKQNKKTFTHAGDFDL